MVKNNKGSVLATTVIFLMIIMIFSFALLRVALAENLESIRHNQQVQAHQNAMSGARTALVLIEDNELDDWLSSEDMGYVFCLDSNYKFNKNVANEDKVAEINIIKENISLIDNETELKIVSTGFHMNRTDTVEITLTAREISEVLDEIGRELEVSLYVTTNTGNKPILDIKGNSSSIIHGDIAVELEYVKNSSLVDSLIFGNYKVDNKTKLKISNAIGSKSTGNEFLSEIAHLIKDYNGSDEGWLVNRHNVEPLTSGYHIPESKIPTYLHSLKESEYSHTVRFSSSSSSRYYIGDNVEIDGNNTIRNGVFRDTLYIDARYNGLQIDGTTFKQDVVILSNYGVVQIEDTIFEGNLYIEGNGDIQIEDSLIYGDFFAVSKKDDVQLRNVSISGNGNSVYLDGDNGVSIIDVSVDKDLYLSSNNNQKIQIDGNMHISGDLTVLNKGTLQLSHRKEGFVGGSILATDRFIDVQEDIKVLKSIVAGSLRLNRGFDIGSEIGTVSSLDKVQSEGGSTQYDFRSTRWGK